jgi:D-alanyl-D-alanine-carboxypeptidase/D-alanyl-D-alanine-endopeptidase
MKWLICGGVIIALWFLATHFARAAEQMPADPEINDLLKERATQSGPGAGIVVGILDKQGSRIIAWGKPNRTSTQTVNGDTVFEIGSATKAFTGILLAEAVERGAMKLDDPVAKFLPQSVKVPTRNGRQITLLDLATHRSGLPRMPDNFAPKDPENPYADYTVEQMYAFLSGYTLPRDIGAEYEYSNVGMGLLGHILALKAGTNYEALVVRDVCRPLGMTNTTITLSAELKARLATGHNAAGAPVPNWDLPTVAGAGALRSTANDLLKFLSANLGLKESDLGPALQLAQKARCAAGSPDMDIGLAWHISKQYGKSLVWHNGGTAGYHSFIGFDPQQKRGVVVLVNSARSIDDIGFHLLEPKYPVARVQPAKERVAIALAPEKLDHYVGRYELARGVYFNLRRDNDRLMAQLTGQPYFQIFPESETEFFYKVVNAQLSFVKGADGKIQSLVLHQNGIDRTAKRISDQPPAERKAIKLDPRIYDAYVGEYELAPGAVFTIRREGDRLMARLTGQSFLEIFPESETEFFYRVVDAQITFVKDSNEKVTGLVLHQNGRNPQARKIK